MAAIVSGAVLLHAVTPHAPTEPAAETLERSLHLTARDRDDVGHGRVIARLLPAHDHREVAVLGAIRITVAPEVFARRLADIVHFKQSPAVLQIGIFSDPPRIDDVQSLTLDQSDVRKLRACRAADCGLRLSAPLIDEAPSHASNAWFREQLVSYVRQYRETGNAALMTYAGTDRPIHLRDEFLDLISRYELLPRFPTVQSVLRHPDAEDANDVRRVIYWSKEQIGPKRVVTITDLVIARIDEALPASYVAASKQIYASQLFETSLSVTVLLPAASPTSVATEVIYLNRSRVDAFHGLFGGIIRTIALRRARSAISDYLERVRDRLERDAGMRR